LEYRHRQYLIPKTLIGGIKMSDIKMQIEVLQNVIYHSCYYTLNQVSEAKRLLKILEASK
jgi:hypothetical protein